MKKGKLIVIEGTDGSGKQTQKNILVEKLESLHISVAGVSFPRYGTPTGNIIGDCYLGRGKVIQRGSWFGDADSVDPKIASLFYAADRRAAQPQLIEMLNNGTIIISDRYVESNMGHQAGKMKNKEKREEIILFIETLEYNLLGMPRPDEVILLHLPPKQSLEAITTRGIEYDGHEIYGHLKHTEKCYLELAEKYHWNRINCMRDEKTRKTPEEVHEEIFHITKRLL